MRVARHMAEYAKPQGLWEASNLDVRFAVAFGTHSGPCRYRLASHTANFKNVFVRLWTRNHVHKAGETNVPSDDSLQSKHSRESSVAVGSNKALT